MRNEIEARKLADKAIKKIDRLEEGESIVIEDRNSARKIKVTTINKCYIYSENIWIVTHEVYINGQREIISDEEIEGLLLEFFGGEYNGNHIRNREYPV